MDKKMMMENTTDPMSELMEGFATAAMATTVQLGRFHPDDASRIVPVLRSEIVSVFKTWVTEASENAQAGLADQLLKLSMAGAAMEVAQRVIARVK